jgi:hypothetical protein
MRSPAHIPRTYKRGSDFPSEAFVQKAVERHFASLGFAVDASSQVDLLCSHPATGERWHIEAKGKTAQPGLDFRTCLGQLLQQIRDRAVNHAVAVPDTSQYTAQIALLAPWVVELLRIHWLLVAFDGSVRVVAAAGHNDERYA